MSNSDWLTIPSEDVWVTIQDQVLACVKEQGGMDQDDIENIVESYIEDNIDQHIHDTIEYSYELLDGDDVIDIIRNQWGEGEYDQVVKDILTEYSAVDMKEVEKLIDARHEEDTATSTELYDQVQELTQRIDKLTETVRVVTNAYAQVVDYVRK
jgi:(2Fe-2S) ferredoxin